MLDNFLQALIKTGAAKSLKRIILVTGAKQYGVHLGRPKNPMEETDPWLTQSTYPPNFYYNQQNILHAFCKEQNIEWTVTYPNDVIGVAKGNFMNLTTSLGLYASVSKEIGQDLEWPGSETFYTRFDCFTDSKLHARFCLWAALEPRAANEAFNVVNGDVESWQNMWPKVASYFGLKVKEDQFAHPAEAPNDMAMDKSPPLSTLAKETGLIGSSALQQNCVEQRIDLVKWSQRDDVKEAWGKLAEREGLEKDGFEKATWGFLGFVLGRNFDLVISMSKARKIGWTGYLDTWDAIEGVFEELKEGSVLPKK
jgi:nucleoside-diphosphate-sugar epimerase